MTGSLSGGNRDDQPMQVDVMAARADDVIVTSSVDNGATHRKLVAARRLTELGRSGPRRSSCHALGNDHRRQVALLSRSIARHGARHPLFAAGGAEGHPSGGTPGISAGGADADMLRSVIKLMMCNDKGSSSRRRSSGGCSSSRRSSRSSGGGGSGDLLKSVIKLMVCQQDRQDSCGSSSRGSRDGDLLKNVIKIMMCGSGRSSGSRRSSGGGAENMMVDVIRLFLCDSRPSGCEPKQILVKLIKLVFELYDSARGGGSGSRRYSGSGSKRRSGSRRYSGSGSKRRSGSRRYSESKKTVSGDGGGSYAYDHASQVTSLPEESDGPAAISEADAEPEPEEEEPEPEPEPEEEE